MLDIFGIIAANILSLPGFLGLGLGMMTRIPILGILLGALVGLAETIVFAKFDFAAVEPLELGIALVVGALAGGLGTLIRRYGATV
ncbi:hypothetical protein R3X27_16880 [Tropicimonas sp. TH_r6]|uniref:hypothetical protein n=1 Tax=Tropicimonas sp. TH_r6 TaxID=3082085 RepID=UPI002955C9E9|nr:hypothetical protein [Tropicimonas sp. TH_r6]MDV7144357.1 hypothetical protein [Tropicimonas sp. TH_r6]